jgi:hypothetical protein
LCGMEQARRSALAHHVHRTAPMGPRVLINGIWYDSSRRRKFVRFDEREDVVVSLELIGLLVPKLETDQRWWKWIIIGAHNAIQGALVCALSGTAEIGALRTDLQSAWLDWFDRRLGPPPDEKLADFKTLLKWGRSPKRMSYLGAGPLKLSATQMRDLHKLHDHFRNNFLHFTPKGWCIEAAGLPRIVLTAVEAAERLMLNTQHVRMHLSGNQIRRLEKCATAIRVSLPDENGGEGARRQSERYG